MQIQPARWLNLIPAACGKPHLAMRACLTCESFSFEIIAEPRHRKRRSLVAAAAGGAEGGEGEHGGGCGELGRVCVRIRKPSSYDRLASLWAISGDPGAFSERRQAAAGFAQGD